MKLIKKRCSDAVPLNVNKNSENKLKYVPKPLMAVPRSKISKKSIRVQMPTN